METIVVDPLTGGWAVRTDAIENPMVFRSGSSAEDTARALAFKLASAGEPVRLRLKLRNSSTEARFICVPPVEPCAPPDLASLPDVRTLEMKQP